MQNLFPAVSPTTRGILALTMALIFLSSMDATVKHLGERYEVFQLVWIRYLGQAVLVLLIISARFRATIRTRSLGLQLLRSFFLFIGTIFFFVGVTSIELGAATAILQINPIFVALGGYFLLGENLGWPKILGVGLGMLGTLIIIRPGSEVFTYWSLFPIGGAVGFAGYAVVTRYLSRSESVWTSLFYTTIIGSFFSSFVVPFFWTDILIDDLFWIGLLAIFGTMGQLLIIVALFWAPATTLAPVSYFSIVVATFFGMVFFGEYPDWLTYLGSVIIIGSGLFVWWAERQKIELSLK